MKLTSPVFNHNDPIPTPYTCDGSDTSPPLQFEDVPSEAASLVLIMEDPDVFRGLWVRNLRFDLAPQEELIEYVCENNKWAGGADE
jgi:phosphatidylethanolamine-binding protein (PEBP) family uncharacterized protein